MRPNATDIESDSILKKYERRPKALEKLCLADLAAWYSFQKLKDNPQDHYQDNDDFYKTDEEDDDDETTQYIRYVALCIKNAPKLTVLTFWLLYQSYLFCSFKLRIQKRLNLHVGGGDGSNVLGFLVSVSTTKCTYVTSCTACLQSRNLSDELIKTQHLLPAGLEVCGLFYGDGSQANAADVLRKCKAVVSLSFLETLDVDKLLILHVASGSEEINDDSFFCYHADENRVDSCDVEIIDDVSLQNELMMFRIKASLTLECEFENINGSAEALAAGSQRLQSKVCESSTVYHVSNSGILMQSDEDRKGMNITEIAADSPCERIVGFIQEDEEEDGFDVPGMKGKIGRKSGKKSTKGKVAKESINIQILSNMSKDNQHIPNSAPILHYQQRNFQHISVHLPINVVAVADKNSPVSTLPSLFSHGICTQIKSMEESLLLFAKDSDILIPEAYHFYLPGFPHLVSTVYPQGKTEEELESHRQTLHSRLMLPKTRPLLRRVNRHVFADEPSTDVYLKNTHVGLPPSGVADGQVSLVYGAYAYHHYMQDRMDDNGWGCAYRSLQTICSWFRLQGYTDKPVPTHREIQQALVDVDDKPAKFVGSRQWIGSIEVSTCLNQLFDVTSKIMFVSNGAELANKGRELAVHFQTQGTPIMIGGGVLAHTILGVDFSKTSGEVKFLILDPHYTGDEDLKVIQDKGWCGWKGTDFWDQTAYYNLCMPQRPIMI
ncbi:ufm1-specific protease 2-like [Ptychodera flava]|uniref:ufm1-specific protease 2-like n=1 Tax=Ptychodera flava TaxID=63121 RepID=UPI003969C49E